MREVLPPRPDERKPFSQDTLSDRFDVDVKAAHHADDDVKVLRQILKAADGEVGGERLFGLLDTGAADLADWANLYTEREPAEYNGSDDKQRRKEEAAERDAETDLESETGGTSEEDADFTKEDSLARYAKHLAIEAEFYRTPFGKVFHVLSCRHVKFHDRRMSCLPVEENRPPCRNCLPVLWKEWDLAGFLE